MSADINRALLRLSKRAETVADRAKLVQTFVDTGALATLLGSHDHQIIFGRRGTGKTHALLYLAKTAADDGDISVYVDLRTIGSTGGIYSDSDLPLTERATRLLADTLCAIHDEFLAAAYDRDELNLAVVGRALDEFVEAATQVVVKGSVEEEVADESTMDETLKRSLSVSVGNAGKLAGSVGADRRNMSSNKVRTRTQGEPRHRVHFGAVGRALTSIARSLNGKRVWILLDEWSTVPLDLQPYLADLIRRAILPVAGLTVKIAAIEHRSAFYLPSEGGDYVGIEPGADASSDLNLDDFMVFDNDARRATEFFRDLLYKHLVSVAGEAGLEDAPKSAQEFVQRVFTQKTPFEDLVKAAEGVPRDAINVLALSAQRADSAQISSTHVRAAAKAWYQRDKEAAVSANPVARSLLYWIVDAVIAHRRARAFLLRAGERHSLIDALFDARVLHLVKRTISAHDEPGARYDVYKIDYGCYVDLLATTKAPQGLIALDEEAEGGDEFLEVPPDDYRAIRRAILDLESFQKNQTAKARLQAADN
jgi:hypothetical protein